MVDFSHNYWGNFEGDDRLTHGHWVWKLELGNKLKAFRKDNGLKQADIQAHLGLSIKTISAIENGTFDGALSKMEKYMAMANVYLRPIRMRGEYPQFEDLEEVFAEEEEDRYFIKKKIFEAKYKTKQNTKRLTSLFKNIMESVELTERYTEGMDEQAFLEDGLTQRAVICNLMAIGTAAKHAELPLKSLIRMSDILLHEYWNVDLKKVWKMVRGDAPSLRDRIMKVFN